MLIITKRRVRGYIAQELLEGQPPKGDPLTEGALDSLLIEQLVAWLEEEFGIVFEDQELVAENFSSIGALCTLVEAKRKGGKPAADDVKVPETSVEALMRSMLARRSVVARRGEDSRT